MLEVEMKFRSPDNEKVTSALMCMGAQRLSDRRMQDVYFSHPGRDFGKTDEAMRLREDGESCELTYKGPRMASQSNSKAREELTVSVDDALAARRLLERLGFEEFATVSKRRASFLLDKLRVDVDEVEGLGEFVELELVTEDPSRAEQLMDMVREKLPLAEAVTETYLEMVLRKRLKGN